MYTIGYINYLHVPGIPEIIRIVPSSSWTSSHTTFLIFFASTSAKSVFSLPGVFHFLFCTFLKGYPAPHSAAMQEFGQDVSRPSWLSIYRFSQRDRNWVVLSLKCTVWIRTITLFVVPTRPTKYRLAELIPWNRFLGSLDVCKFGLSGLLVSFGFGSLLCNRRKDTIKFRKLTIFSKKKLWWYRQKYIF